MADSAGRVGFIGLGNMGRRIVELLLEGGQEVSVWARRQASAAPFTGRVEVADSPAALGRSCQVVGLCVWDEKDVADVLLREDGVLAGLQPGGVVVVHSTIGPEACRRFAAAAADRGGSLVDAPVSFRGPDRKLLVMLGGDVSVIESFRPVFDAIGDPVIRVGDVGGGQMAKLLNNTMLAATVALGSDVVALGQEMGLDPNGLLQVLSAGSASGTWSLQLTRAMAGASAMPGRTHEWATKDVALTVELASATGARSDRDALRLAMQAGPLLDGPP